MDLLDLKIIRLMGLRPYGSHPQNVDALKPSWIASRLAVEPETVKSRLAKMEEAGLIRFYQLYPNLGHLGLEAAAYLFRVADDDRKLEAMERAKMIEGLFEVHNFIGTEMCVDLSFRTGFDLSKKLQLLSEFSGDEAPTRFYDRYMPPVERALTPLDWRIMKALRYHAKRPLSEVSTETGVSLKTVRRRYDRMAAEGSFFIVPAIDPSKAPGVILFELLLYTKPDADAATIQRILEVYDDRYVYHYVPSSPALGNLDLLLFAESTGEIEDLRQRGRDIEGVAKVSALVFRGWSEYTDWIDAAIDSNIRTA